MLSKRQIEELSEIIKQHVNWLTWRTLGSRYITEVDLTQLKSLGLLPMDVQVETIKNSFVLGRLEAILKEGEWNDLPWEKLQEAASRKQTVTQHLQIEASEMSAVTSYQNLENEVSQGLFSDLASATQKTITEGTVKGIIKDKIKIGVEFRKNYREVARDLEGSLQEGTRNWERVASTEMHSARQRGVVSSIVEKDDIYAHGEGEDSLVAIRPDGDACSDCKRLYLDPKTGHPKIFKLKEVLENEGSNYIKPWRQNIRPVVPPAHPNCYCRLRYVPRGWGWTKEGRFTVVDSGEYKESFQKSIDILAKVEGPELVNSLLEQAADVLKSFNGSQKDVKRPKILAVDWDGTITNSNEGELTPPLPGVNEKLKEFKDKGWVIVIWTVRKETPELVAHLKKHDVPFDYINKHPWQPEGASHKILADVYIDDRAVTFSGKLDDYDHALIHSPWWKKLDIKKSDGEFRGGDPEAAQEKREEQRQEQEDLEESLNKCDCGLACKCLGKAQPGEEPGEFRGGDPELLQEKREEKREEREDAGDVDEGEGEEPDMDEIAELQEEEEQKEAEKSIAAHGYQVSPVNTGSDYQFTNVNGDNSEQYPKDSMPDVKQFVRPGKNQRKPWSEVTGFKLPLQGNPWVYLRRYLVLDKNKEAAQVEATAFLKAQLQAKTYSDTEHELPNVDYTGLGGSQEVPQYQYEDKKTGNVYQGTNAPKDHADYDKQKGEPGISPTEVNPQDHPEFFDDQDRKLNQSVPDGVEVEDNPDYDPDKSKGNFWVKKYQEPSTGEPAYVYLHRDFVKDPKMKNNYEIRLLDTQLSKIRNTYKDFMRSSDEEKNVIGLLLALMDQGRIKVKHGLDSVMVEDVKILEENKVKIKMLIGLPVTLELDAVPMKVLSRMLNAKTKGDLLFTAKGQKFNYHSFANFMNENFGVTPEYFLVYQATEIFSKEFNSLIRSSKEDLDAASLEALKAEALNNTAKILRIEDQELISTFIDPIAVEALILAANAFSKRKALVKGAYKLQGKVDFQGLPISIENKKGSIRTWYDPHNKERGSTKMHYDYGYIRKTKGTDGDQVDVYVGPEKDSQNVYVVHQMKAPKFKDFDEDKVLIGFTGYQEARAAYIKQYNNPKFYGSMTPMSMKRFKKIVFETLNNPKMIKSQSSDKPIKIMLKMPEHTTDEAIFSEWVHTYPLHEHYSHWGSFSAKLEDQDAKDQEKKTSGLSADLNEVT